MPQEQHPQASLHPEITVTIDRMGEGVVVLIKGVPTLFRHNKTRLCKNLITDAEIAPRVFEHMLRRKTLEDLPIG